MFDLQTPWWELIARVSIVYLAVLVMVRVTGKRQLGQLAPMDLLTVLLLAETVAPSLIGEEFSIQAGLIAAATLLALTYLNGWLAYRFPGFERAAEGSPRILIRNGKLDREVMRREQVTHQEIGTALRRNGLASAAQVSLCMIEPDGELTFLVPPSGPEAQRRGGSRIAG